MTDTIFTFKSNEELIHENRRNWIRALESGSFEQARYGLATVRNRFVESEEKSIAYCCIGVECEVNGFTPTSELLANSAPDYGRFRDRVNINCKFMDYLITMNDDRKRSFRFIARFLRISWQIKD